MATYCAIPNYHLQIKPNGIVKPCCRFDVEEAKGIQPESGKTLQAIYTQPWQNLRDQLKSPNVPEGCRKCVTEEAAGLTSMRVSEQQASKKFGIHADQVGLCDLEIGFGNLCNLSCRTCSSHLSTKWYDDDVYLNQNLSFFRKVAKERKVDVDFELNDRDLLKNLQSVKFTGGEPFLHKNFILFLETLINVGTQDRVKLRICTNASFFPTEKTLEVLSQFRYVDISVSIDGFGKYNDYLRYPSLWHETEAVLGLWVKKIQAQSDWSMTLCSTISAYSIVGINELGNWWSEFTCELPTKQFHLLHQPVFDPYYLAPSLLPKEIVKKFSITDPSVSKYFNSKTAQGDSLRKFYEFTKKLDARRGESFENVFPVLAQQVDLFLANKTAMAGF